MLQITKIENLGAPFFVREHMVVEIRPLVDVGIWKEWLSE